MVNRSIRRLDRRCLASGSASRRDFSGHGCSRSFSFRSQHCSRTVPGGHGGRHVGLWFASLVVLAPAYLQVASIARVYGVVAFSLCLILAMIARTLHCRTRGELVGLASLVGLWVSYLLWPLALAAPWLAQLKRRDRVRLMAALGLTVPALAPRVINGLLGARQKQGVFHLQGPVDTGAHVLAVSGGGPVGGPAGTGELNRPARLIATALIFIGCIALWRRNRRQLGVMTLSVLFAAVPVLALLAGGHGIRDRHTSRCTSLSPRSSPPDWET